MYEVIACVETDDVTALRDIVMTTGDDVLLARCDVIDVDILLSDVTMATVLVTLVLELVVVVMATGDDVISEWTGRDDVVTWRDDGDWALPVGDAVCPLVWLLVVLLVVVMLLVGVVVLVVALLVLVVVVVVVV